MEIELLRWVEQFPGVKGWDTRLSKKLDVLALARMVGHRDPRSLVIYYLEKAKDIALKLD